MNADVGWLFTIVFSGGSGRFFDGEGKIGLGLDVIGVCYIPALLKFYLFVFICNAIN